MTNAALILGPAIRAACTHATVALTDNLIVSDLDAADSEGNWEPVVQPLAQNVPTTMPQMELAFIGTWAPPPQPVPSTGEAGEQFSPGTPAATPSETFFQCPPSVMRALVWEAVTIGASKSVIKAILDAAFSRHRDAGLPPPSPQT